ADGRELHFTSAAAARYFLKSVSTDNLLKMKRGSGVYLELLLRPGVRDEYRKEALTGLAKLDKKSELRVLLDTIGQHDQSPARERGGADDSVLFDLIRLLTSRDAKELTNARPEIEKLATSAKSPLTRQLGYVALIAADGQIEKAWALATKSVPALQDLVN